MMLFFLIIFAFCLNKNNINNNNIDNNQNYGCVCVYVVLTVPAFVVVNIKAANFTFDLRINVLYIH